MFEIASSRRYAQKCACAPEFAHIYARKRRRAKSLTTNIGTIPKNMSTNFQIKRLKLNLDIVEKPENRVHKLTDSNVSPFKMPFTFRFDIKYLYCQVSLSTYKPKSKLLSLSIVGRLSN